MTRTFMLMAALGIVLSASLPASQLIVGVYGASPVVEYRGWYVDNYNVTVAVVGQTVTTSWFASGAPVNDYRLRIMQQISGSPPAEMTRFEFHYGGGSQYYNLSFIPSVAKGEANTVGYYVDLWGNVASVWTLLWTMDNVYPPRLTVVARSPMQGDLTLNNSDVAVFDGTMNANGSLFVHNNSTLILKNTALNFTQTADYQFQMKLEYPANGNPRLIVDNATITSNNHALRMYIDWNSMASINHMATGTDYVLLQCLGSSSTSISDSSIYVTTAMGYSFVTAENSSFYQLSAYDDSDVSATNCTMQSLSAASNSNLTATNSTVTDYFTTVAKSVNCTATQLRPGLVDRWNFKLNSSVTVASGGYAPNSTLVKTRVQGWTFQLFGLSNATFPNTELEQVISGENATVILYNSTVLSISPQGNGTIWLFNSTYSLASCRDSSKAYVSWYLDAHVLDSIGQVVPSATVSAHYQNSTLAESETTNSSGWTTLTLMEKMVNATGSYPVGDYNVSAAYLTYLNSTNVNMNQNQQITLTFSGFIAPEFPSSVVLPMLIATMLLATIAWRKKRAHHHPCTGAQSRHQSK